MDNRSVGDFPVYRLFNAMNNMFPILFVDIRCPVDFALHHIRGAVSCPFPLPATAEGAAPLENDTAGGDVLSLLRSTTIKRSQVAMVVLCLPSAPVPETRHWLEETLVAPMLTALATLDVTCPAGRCELVDYSDFYARYSLCKSLFAMGTDMPQLRPVKPVYYASEILPGFLFLGDYGNGSSVEELRALGITHVVDATNERLSQAACQSLAGAVQYLPIDVWDTPEEQICLHFPAVNAVVASAAAVSGRVLVHCRAGWSRSPSLVLAYLMQAGGKGGAPMSLANALRIVLRERPMACPNPGFRDQLRGYDLLRHAEAANPPDVLADDAAFMSIVHEMNVMWRPSVTSETDFDRIPLSAKLWNGPGNVSMPTELPSEDPASADAAPPRPVKPFLRRGEGGVKRSR
jgi:dual specificity phosphatase 3